MPAELPSGIHLTYTQQYRRCGKPDCPLCMAAGRGHGPYWYAYWREGGRTRSRYLGKQLPPDLAAPQPAPAAGRGIPAASPGLRVRTLGGFALWRGEKQLSVERWERQKIGALCKWLVSAPSHRLTRDEVVERFWPEGEPEQGMANLRVLVHRLRRALGEQEGKAQYLRYDGEALALVPGAAAWLDADAFAQTAQAALAGQDAAACRAALALYMGDYLPGDAYEEWAVERREVLRHQRQAVLLHQATLCAADGETEEAEGCLRAVLAVDPCHEAAALALMRLHVGAGRPGQALRVYRRLADALRDDLELEPEEEIRSLHHMLRAQQAPVPPIPPAAELPTNLPAPLTGFIGRRHDLTAIRSLLVTPPDSAEASPCRLLTLTGSGGAGKTRLALQVADGLLDEPRRYPDGVWVVELATLADPALLATAVAGSLGVQEQQDTSLLDSLVASLRLKRMLLVLDNCEHLIDASAALVAAVLMACPGVQVLATSRKALAVAGEIVYRVPPLSLPAADGQPVIARLLESEAARLFLARARARQPDFEITEAIVPVIAAICRQLDGLPLAIELAAARVSVLSVEQIAARLDRCFALLTGGPRTALPRHQTLRAALDWSYDLLDEWERALLRRLAVFAGGCTLEAAEAVCTEEGMRNTHREPELLNLLDGLVSASLVQMIEEDGATHYRLLETVRQYGREQLAAAGEAASFLDRHLGWCVALAEQAAPLLQGAEQRGWLGRLETEHDNLRAALAWSVSVGGDSAQGLRLAGTLARFWHLRGHVTEGRRWLDAVLARDKGADAILRARALNAAGVLATVQQGYAAANRLLGECLALRRTLGDTRGVAQLLVNLGNVAYDQGDYERARILHEESLAQSRELGDKENAAHALNNLGNVACDQGDYERAMALFEESLALCREVGDTHDIALALGNLADIAFNQGDYERTSALLKESLALRQDLMDKPGILMALEMMAVLAGVQRHAERAAALFGAADALRAVIDIPPMSSEQAARERTLPLLLEALGEEAFAAARAAGHEMALQQAVAFALRDTEYAQSI